MAVVNVELRDRPYPVHVGPKAREMLGALIPSGARRVAVITQDQSLGASIPDLRHSPSRFPKGNRRSR